MTNFLGGKLGIAYVGTNAPQPPNFSTADRDPTIYDYANYTLGDMWLNRISQEPFMLVSQASSPSDPVRRSETATWLSLQGGTQTITGDTGGAVGPDTTGTINLISGIAGISFDGNPATNTITLNVSGGGALLQFLQGDTGGQVAPDATNTIYLLGTAGIVVTTGNPGINTITWSLDGSIATSYVEDSGTAVPAAHILEIVGGYNIDTAGATNVVTINVTGTTNHALQVGNSTASLNSLTAALDGEVPIGSTGVDPVIATLTAGTGINISNGPGSITVSLGATTRPLFQAYLTGSTVPNITGDGTVAQIPFDATFVDNTASFNTTTHQYVVPVAGYYYFSTDVGYVANIGLTGGFYWDIAIRQNGTEVLVQNGGLPTRRQVANFWSSNNAVDQFYAGILQCAVNDTIDVRVTGYAGGKTDAVLGSSGNPGAATGFAGYLIGKT